MFGISRQTKTIEYGTPRIAKKLLHGACSRTIRIKDHVAATVYDSAPGEVTLRICTPEFTAVADLGAKDIRNLLEILNEVLPYQPSPAA